MAVINREFRNISEAAREALERNGAAIRSSKDYPDISLVDFPEGTTDSSSEFGGSPGTLRSTAYSYRLPDGTELDYESRGTLRVSK